MITDASNFLLGFDYLLVPQEVIILNSFWITLVLLLLLVRKTAKPISFLKATVYSNMFVILFSFSMLLLGFLEGELPSFRLFKVSSIILITSKAISLSMFLQEKAGTIVFRNMLTALILSITFSIVSFVLQIREIRFMPLGVFILLFITLLILLLFSTKYLANRNTNTHKNGLKYFKRITNFFL
jgi:hypothetical protein